MGFWNRTKPQTSSSEEQRRWYSHFLEELLDYCSYLENTSKPPQGYRYCEMLSDAYAFTSRVRAALLDAPVALPEALARLLFDLFYTDKDIIGYVALVRHNWQQVADRLRTQLSSLEGHYRSLGERLQRAQESASQALGERGALQQQLDEQDERIDQLNRLLKEKDEDVRQLRQVVRRQQEDLNRLRR